MDISFDDGCFSCSKFSNHQNLVQVFLTLGTLNDMLEAGRTHNGGLLVFAREAYGQLDIFNSDIDFSLTMTVCHLVIVCSSQS